MLCVKALFLLKLGMASFLELSGLTMTALEQSFVARWPYEALIGTNGPMLDQNIRMPVSAATRV